MPHFLEFLAAPYENYTECVLFVCLMISFVFPTPHNTRETNIIFLKNIR
jgi:hypothetical protein